MCVAFNFSESCKIGIEGVNMKFLYALKCFIKNVRRLVNSDYKLRKRLNRIKFVTSIIIVVVICIAISYKKLSLKKQQLSYERQLASIEKDLEQEQDRTNEIKEYKAYVQTKQFAEEVAREKLGLVYPGEVIFEVEDE